MSKAVGSHAVPVKGVGDGYPPKRVIKTLDEWGRAGVVLKSDGEPAIMEMKREAVKRAREEVAVEVIFEESHAYVSQTNGVIEQAVGAVKAKTRTLKFAVEEMHR